MQIIVTNRAMELFMNNLTQSIRNQRRPKGIVTSVSTNYIHLRNPYVIAMWSAFFPGFGHISLGSYAQGFILFLWEMLVNINAHINMAILYSFQGKFELAKDIINKRWVYLYVPVFIYAIMSSYRVTVDLNKLTKLAEFERSPIIPFSISALEINYLDKRNPWFTASISLFMPGVGHLTTNRLPAGFFVLGWLIAISYNSHLIQSIYFSFVFDFAQAKTIVNPEWLLFLPSIFGFAIYDAYVNAVEYNKLFDIEQSRFLKDNYQSADFDMPI